MSVKKYIMATRPRSLPAFSSPVIVAIAYMFSQYKYFSFAKSILCVFVSLFLQIALNLLNDYQEGKKGLDKHKQDGHIVSVDKEHSKNILIFAIISFVIVGISGTILIIISNKYWLFIIGILCFCAAFFYTGGPKPYGYYALAEIPAFLFPGPIALYGTIYVQNIQMDVYAILLSCIFGLFSCAILMNDNLRDIAIDPKFGKKTLAVVLGEKKSKILFCLYIGICYILLIIIALKIHTFIILFILIPLHIKIIKSLLNSKGAKLLKSLDLTGLSELLFTILCIIVLLLS
jgi:1,4-dihydroxy-2-naphthoate octaprenyltransferase